VNELSESAALVGTPEAGQLVAEPLPPVENVDAPANPVDASDLEEECEGAEAVVSEPLPPLPPASPREEAAP
jgi:hypothetical protein